MDKIYCFDCAYYHTQCWGGGCNKILGYTDTPFNRQVVYASPEKDNKYNDCIYFEEMPLNMYRKFLKLIRDDA